MQSKFVSKALYIKHTILVSVDKAWLVQNSMQDAEDPVWFKSALWKCSAAAELSRTAAGTMDKKYMYRKQFMVKK